MSTAVDWALAEKVAVRVSGREPFAESYYYDSLEPISRSSPSKRSPGRSDHRSAFAEWPGVLGSQTVRWIAANIVCSNVCCLDRQVR